MESQNTVKRALAGPSKQRAASQTDMKAEALKGVPLKEITFDPSICGICVLSMYTRCC